MDISRVFSESLYPPKHFIADGVIHITAKASIFRLISFCQYEEDDIEVGPYLFLILAAVAFFYKVEFIINLIFFSVFPSDEPS